MAYRKRFIPHKSRLWEIILFIHFKNLFYFYVGVCVFVTGCGAPWSYRQL